MRINPAYAVNLMSITGLFGEKEFSTGMKLHVLAEWLSFGFVFFFFFFFFFSRV